jgi:hypothetical protein
MSNLLHNAIRKGINARAIQREITRIRAEHDAFVRTATLGTTYYTAEPHSTYDGYTGRPVHVPITFTRKGSGIHAGQLIAADSNSPSWAIWNQYGPLTTQSMPTADDYRNADDAAFAGASARMQQQTTAAATAEIRRLYPVSARHLVAA